MGNPTILATFTVIAAVLPMAFVRGLMGPYMRPIPVGSSAAMLFSLFIAFVISPWAALRLFKPRSEPMRRHRGGEPVPDESVAGGAAPRRKATSSRRSREGPKAR